MITKEKILKLNNLDLDYLWISFEGLKENHDRLRGSGNFEKVIKKVELISKYFKGRKAIRMSINKYNIDEAPQLLRIAEKYNFDLIRYTPLLDYGRAEGLNLHINSEEYIRFLNMAMELKSDTVKIVFPNQVSNKIWTLDNGFGCHCGKEAIWIDELGNVSPCIFWGNEYLIGNVKTHCYKELWNRSLEVSNLEGNEICKSCANYKNCRGGCRARSLFEYGNLNEVDPLCPLKKSNER